MDMTSLSIVLGMVKRGDIIEVKSIDKLPNMGGTFNVDYVTDKEIVYGCSCTCDGYALPFYAIKDIKIIGNWLDSSKAISKPMPQYKVVKIPSRIGGKVTEFTGTMDEIKKEYGYLLKGKNPRKASTLEKYLNDSQKGKEGTHTHCSFRVREI